MDGTFNCLVNVKLSSGSKHRIGISIFNDFLESNIYQQISKLVLNHSLSNSGIGKISSICSIMLVDDSFFENKKIFPVIIVGSPNPEQVKRDLASKSFRSITVKISERVVTKPENS